MKTEVLSKFSAKINGVYFEDEHLFNSTSEVLTGIKLLNGVSDFSDDFILTLKDAIEEHFVDSTLSYSVITEELVESLEVNDFQLVVSFNPWNYDKINGLLKKLKK